MKKILLIVLSVVFFIPQCFSTEYEFVAQNASQPKISTSGSGCLGENIVYDSVTGLYWWIFTDASGANNTIRMASASTVEGVWTIQAGNVIAVGGQDVTSPHLVKFGSTWYIYFGNVTSGNKGMYVYTSSSVNTGYTVANGGSPILSVGGGGTWDENRILEPDVIYKDGTYYMLYMGESVGTLLEKIGLATSSDPITGWTKYGSNPVLAGLTNWYDQGSDRAADPIIFDYGGTIYVGVAATNSSKNNWHNIFFKTTDFINYTLLGNHLVLTWTYSGASDWDVTSTHRGHFFQDNNGEWWMPYTGKNNTTYKGGIGRLSLVPKAST